MSKRKRAAMQTPTMTPTDPQTDIPTAAEPNRTFQDPTHRRFIGDVEQPQAVSTETEMTAESAAPAELPKHTLFVDVGVVPVVVVPMDVPMEVAPTPMPVAPPTPVQVASTPAMAPVLAPVSQAGTDPQAGTAPVPPQQPNAKVPGPQEIPQLRGPHTVAFDLYDVAIAELKGKPPQEVALNVMYFLTESLVLMVGMAAGTSEPMLKFLLQNLGAQISGSNPTKLLETVNVAMSLRLMESLAPKPKK